MENRSHALAAGLFTLFLGLAVALSIWWFGGKHEATTEYTVVTRHNVTGLSLQGQVRYRGIRVGKVQAIELDPRTHTTS
jgi:phospholipid/cholesterol/gamma-HCH transport system substrate-binding protein